MRFFFIAVLCFVCFNLKAQKAITSDTIKVQAIKPHSPTKATLMSTFLPGLGQAYNKKYWKIPVIYAGIGTGLYFAIYNQKEFKKYKEAYILRTDNDSTTVDEFTNEFSSSALLNLVNFHQKNRDLMFIVSGAVYILNIVDAAVDAHLYDFNVNDNLSFHFQPRLFNDFQENYYSLKVIPSLSIKIRL
jgi:hypothetical protein